MNVQSRNEMSAVGRDIMNIKIDMDRTFNETMNDFYDIMRKHGIKQGTRNGNAITLNNFEWTMCFNLFIGRFDYELRFKSMIDGIPEDLHAYDEEDDAI